MPKFKLIRTVTFMPDVPPEAKVLYFDLEQDPGEQQPVTALQDVRLNRAWRALEDELDEIRARWRRERRSPDAERNTDLFDSFAFELQALGYVEQVDPNTLVSAEEPRPWGRLAPMERWDAPGRPALPRFSRRTLLAAGLVALTAAGLGGLLGRWLLRRRRS